MLKITNINESLVLYYSIRMEKHWFTKLSLIFVGVVDARGLYNNLKYI